MWDGLVLGEHVGTVAVVAGIAAVDIALAGILADIRLAAHIQLLAEQLVLGGLVGQAEDHSMRRVWVVERKKPDL